MKKTKKTGSASARPEESGAGMRLPLTIQESPTLANLQTAYTGESSAHDRYVAFAKEAEEEGYEPVASLFRAAARGEEIHARNHLEVLKGNGAWTQASVETFGVQSTVDSLQEAILGEVYERDVMYPSFVHQARAEGSRQAARSFQLAQKAETQHAALFTQALQDLQRMRGEAVPYFVCSECGFISARADARRCPVCSAPADQFEKVS
jgi:rubrerythrin